MILQYTECQLDFDETCPSLGRLSQTCSVPAVLPPTPYGPLRFTFKAEIKLEFFSQLNLTEKDIKYLLCMNVLMRASKYKGK